VANFALLTLTKAKIEPALKIGAVTDAKIISATVLTSKASEQIFTIYPAVKIYLVARQGNQALRASNMLT
jgi:hypothetical protein